MKTFLFGLIVGVCLVPAFVFFYIRMGYVPVATSAGPLPFERRLANMALKARIAKEAPGQAPMAASEANLIAGAKVYREDCAGCHGIPGQPQSPVAKGMFPVPPKLVEGKGVTDDPVGRTYWVATYGIRLTGMPGFMGNLTDEQIWQVSLLLANADKLPAPAGKILAQP
jgi:thiosulfate dehydrogenase